MDFIVFILIVAGIITLYAGAIFQARRRRQFSNSHEIKTDSPQSQTATKASMLMERSNPRIDSTEELMRAAEKLLENTHDYVKWNWKVQAYSDWLLRITYPYNWRPLGELTYYYIPWVNISTGTNPLAASLSWVNTQSSVHDVLQDSFLRENMTSGITDFIQDYFRIDNDPEITLNDRFSGRRPYSRDSITEEIYKNIDRLKRRDKIEEFRQVYYGPDTNMQMHVFDQIPYEGASIGEHVISFPTQETICAEVSTRGLRYLIFFFDKLPSCVCEFHLIRFEESNFNDFDYILAAYFIQNLQVNSDLLKLEQLQGSQQAPTLAAGWHNLVRNSNNGTTILSRIDRMSGLEFEHFVAQLLKSRGYEVEVTKGSGDFGIDVVAKKQGVNVGIQVKRQTDKVSRNAVSDAVAGKSYYHCDRSMVITNNYFHDSAIILAHSTKCELVDRDTLQLWITESYQFSIKSHFSS